MAFIHPHSNECLVSELDLFSLPDTQTSIENSSYVEYNPISTLSDSAPIEFYVSGQGSVYIDLTRSKLYVKAEITLQNGNAITNQHHVGPVNNFLHSLFSEVDVRMNDTLVSTTNNTYPYRAYLETLLSYGQNAKTSQLTSQLYYKDKAGAMHHTNPHEVLANPGLKARHAFFEDGGVVEMLGRIHSDLFFQDKLIP